jgi:hypothetical protein
MELQIFAYPTLLSRVCSCEAAMRRLGLRPITFQLFIRHNRA